MAVLAIDFDNTLVNGEEALPFAREAINILREDGHKVIIHSANDVPWIAKVLREHRIMYDKIWDNPGKPLADLYIDDRGFDFKGSWTEALPEILGHRHVKDKDNRKW